jgi:hypothetical protein
VLAAELEVVEVVEFECPCIEIYVLFVGEELDRPTYDPDQLLLAGYNQQDKGSLLHRQLLPNQTNADHNLYIHWRCEADSHNYLLLQESHQKYLCNLVRIGPLALPIFLQEQFFRHDSHLFVLLCTGSFRMHMLL